MKTLPAECVAHALAALWAGMTLLSAGVQEAAPVEISNENALWLSAGAGCVFGALAYAASKGGQRERVATFLASIGCAVAGGPISATLLMVSYSVEPRYFMFLVLGASSFWALVGWPLYKLMLALFVASGENASGLGAFFGALIDVFLRRKG